jgi:hypothetical protein
MISAEEAATPNARNLGSLSWFSCFFSRNCTLAPNDTTEAATAADISLGRWRVPDYICGALLRLGSTSPATWEA